MFQLLHLSDPHFGTAVPTQSDTLLEIAHHLNPDFTLISGDFSMRARKHEMIAAQAWLKKLTKPQLTIPGNHDVPLLNHPIDRFFGPFKRYKKYINEDLEPTAETAAGRLISFNSSTPFGLHIDWSRGFLSPFQCSRMATAFDDNPPGLRMVTFHHPIHRKTDSTRILASPAPLIKSSLASGCVDLLMSGHFHQSYCGVLDLQSDGKNLVVSQTSTACSSRTKGEPAGFHYLHLSDNKIIIDQYAWGADQFNLQQTHTFEKTNSTWTQLV